MTEGSAPRLQAALAAGDRRAARSEVVRAGDDRDRRDDLLDVVAAAAAAGDGVALEVLVEVVDELGLARRAVHQVLVDEQAVADVAQDTLIAVATSIGGFRGASRFTTWLHAIARRRAVDHLRRRSTTVPLAAHDVGDAQRLSSVIASRQSMRQLIDRLPADYRDVVVLRELDQLPYDEVAAQVGRNVSTVRSQVARGRSLLAAMLDAGPDR